MTPTALDFGYAPALESTASVALRERYGLFIGGEWVVPGDGRTFATANPATEETLAHVASASAADVDRAVRAARRGYEKYWRKLRAAERAKYIYRIARVLSERAREFAVLETLDCGKPIRESRDFDIPQATAHFFYHAGWADKLAWAVNGPDRTRPLGVVGAIVPFNFPLLIAAWKIAPALACGNTVVLKPAETTPLTALAFADVCAEADLPPGIVNVVTGDGTTGAALVEHPDVDKISFTGSTEVGKSILRATAGTPKRVALELGGKSAFVVYDDAPLDQAIEGIVSAIYFNTGHVCCAGSRLLVQESIAEEVVERLRARLATIRHGDPLDKNTDIGAINSRAQRDRIAELAAGARLLVPRIVLHERATDVSDRTGGNLRARPFDHDVPYARRSDRASEQPSLRPCGRRVDLERIARALYRATTRGRGGLVQYVQPIRPEFAVRRVQRVGFRSRRRSRRIARVPGHVRVDNMGKNVRC
jgi:aldehyde dehydrogenase (NAD+)